jgi:hypothetical protein
MIVQILDHLWQSTVILCLAGLLTLLLRKNSAGARYWLWFAASVTFLIPLSIWWLGARLIAERERACDEAVLATGNDAQIYAKSILKVCRFFRHSALACTSGVSGADLTRRVEEIMSGRSARPVGRPKKLLVSISIAGALIGMALVGGQSTPVAEAQTSNSEIPTPAERAKLLTEQTRPQKEVPFIPADFDRFVGYYKDTTSGLYARVYRERDRYYSQLTGQSSVEFFPESPTEFFATVVAAQISFVSNTEGRVTEMVIHQNGFLRPWLRISKSAYDAFETDLQQRIKGNEPSSGTEAAVRRQIEEAERTGHALYAEMDAPLAAAARKQQKQMEARFKMRGALQSIRFSRVLPNGDDVYLVTFAHTQAEVIITPLLANGKIAGMLIRDLP